MLWYGTVRYCPVQFRMVQFKWVFPIKVGPSRHMQGGANNGINGDHLPAHFFLFGFWYFVRTKNLTFRPWVLLWMMINSSEIWLQRSLGGCIARNVRNNYYTLSFDIFERMYLSSPQKVKTWMKHKRLELTKYQWKINQMVIKCLNGK